jgi:cellulose synthase/poly-beta-1,6-N-acetylglucosamine synthase-like glycosyltransferase
VTVIVPACGDAACLAESLRHNLALPHPLRFILVPAARSTDGTVELCERTAKADPRVQVVLGDTGSKAGDLNKAWAAVRTDAVLLLDADETVDPDSLRWGLAALRQPGVGVVQGRKVSRAPDDGFLARFVSSERRYSTWLDQVMHADQLGSTHFGGSAALLRRQVVPDVGGWTERTLTEDIEFTLRTHLDGRWRIALETRMVVREADPRTFADLLRQRTRWARGWAQNLDLYLGDVVRARRRLGLRRAFGLTLLLLIAVSALWTTFVPATMLMRLGGVSPLLPFALAVPLSLVLLPSRLLAYGFAALRDPVIPLPRTPRALAELALQAYLWILLGWLVQLHALYLELSRAPRAWDVTGKRAPVPDRGGAQPA